MTTTAQATDRMTSRQRMLAAYRGEAVDRLPYWAKVTNSTWRSGQPQHVRDMDDFELLDYIHADGIFGAGNCVRQVLPHVQTESRREGAIETRVTHTPDGDLLERWSQDPYTKSWHPIEFPVKTRGDIGRYRWLYTDARSELEEAALAQARDRVRRVGDRGVTHTSWGTTPLMHLVEHVIGPVNTHLFLADFPGEMDELIGLMHATDLARSKRIAETTPADIVVSVENTSTTLISPQQFERYCFGHLCDHGRAIQGAGKLHELHMCGQTLALLERIDTIPAASIEAFTAPTLGNTRLADGRRRAPSKTLVGGTRVNTWLMEIEAIQRYILAELADCPDHRHIVLTTAGVAPPACPAEKFRAIGQWIATVPIRV